MNGLGADRGAAVAPPPPGDLAVPGQLRVGSVVRLDLAERLTGEVDDLLGRRPAPTERPGPARVAAWTAEVDTLLAAAVGDHDRARLLDARSRVRAELGEDRAGAGADARRAAVLYERTGDVVPAAANYAAAAMAAVHGEGDVREALDAAVHALVAFGALEDGDHDPLAEARMAEMLGRLCHQFFDYDRALQFYELSARALRGDDDPTRWPVAVQLIAEVLVVQAERADDPGRRERLLARVEQLADRLVADGEPYAVRAVDAPRLRATVQCVRGRADLAWPLLEAAAAASGDPPLLGDVSALHVARGRCLLRLRRPADALAELDAAVAAYGRAGDVAGRTTALELRSVAREESGDLAGALRDARGLAGQVWHRHQEQAAGFMDQVWSRAGVEGERRSLEARAKDLVRFAEQDSLTGLDNRRALERFCAALDPEQPVCLVLVDVDHFKAVNDRYGHPAGDAVLREVGGLLAACVRGDDRVGRWGGEEFLVALPGEPAGAGAEAAERMRRRIEEHPWSLHAPGLRLTVSAGVAAARAGDLPAVLDRADAALYAAKRRGRNRVETA